VVIGLPGIFRPTESNRYAFALLVYLHNTPDAYARLARNAIDGAWAWAAHVHKGELQFRVFSNRGIVVVDQHMRIRGFYNPGDIEKAFDGYKKRVLWLKLSKNPRPGSS